MAGTHKPEGYHDVTPYLIVDDADAAIRFYTEALGATELFRLPMGDKVGHAEIKVGDSHVMISDEWPDMGMTGPNSRGGPTATFMLYVADADAAHAQAIAAGATEAEPVTDKFWGDRAGAVTDPFGHRWTFATHVEEVAPDELQRRMDAWSKQAEPA